MQNAVLVQRRCKSAYDINVTTNEEDDARINIFVIADEKDRLKKVVDVEPIQGDYLLFHQHRLVFLLKKETYDTIKTQKNNDAGTNLILFYPFPDNQDEQGLANFTASVISQILVSYSRARQGYMRKQLETINIEPLDDDISRAVLRTSTDPSTTSQTIETAYCDAYTHRPWNRAGFVDSFLAFDHKRMQDSIKTQIEKQDLVQGNGFDSMFEKTGLREYESHALDMAQNKRQENKLDPISADIVKQALWMRAVRHLENGDIHKGTADILSVFNDAAAAQK
jgi:hypothetical protein